MARASMRDVRADHRRRWPLGGPLEAYSRIRDVTIALFFIAFGVVAFTFPLALAERVVLLGLAMGGLFRLGITLRARRKLRPHGMVALEGKALVRRENGASPATLVDLSGPFGITVLANPMRTAALLAFTTPNQTRYQRVRVISAEDAANARELLNRAITVPDADAMGSQELDCALTAANAAEMVRLAERHSPSALSRMYLTGSRGEVLVLDGTELTIDNSFTNVSFDLSSPLDWKGFMFHEAVGPIATVYQATWIRQAGVEIVLVAPMPAEVTTTLPPGAAADMKADDQRAVLRDLKLMQSTADAPPPRELRIGVERLFMLPLRQVLDRAPRASRADIPPARALNPSA